MAACTSSCREFTPGKWELMEDGPDAALLAVQVAAGALAFVVMIVLSRNALVVEMKRQFCRNEKMKTLLRAG